MKHFTVCPVGQCGKHCGQICPQSINKTYSNTFRAHLFIIPILLLSMSLSILRSNHTILNPHASSPQAESLIWQNQVALRSAIEDNKDMLSME